ncbi:hypothetical protein PLICRDRAFT_180825 [Plicaturopsis crispa FD-325 SS-3]|uniref:Unplaced genomic scaffold PLICRscaffold_36, whole genome shotgun sequence n=1 Tax=Plicaturopsis crispa FD-325 SS-3 TaxID=944288 RepID=A0A0C9SK25_PLICR|nr:hypothetical protein PLICRDRAFT_180825 [Plicaturopsis crispa FD-325 SS-3]
MTSTITDLYSRPGDESISWSDARCLAVTGNFVITSPNVDHVPFFNLGTCRVQTRADGRFGYADYTQTPQRYSMEFAHSCLIPLKPRDADDRPAAFWLTPRREYDFELVPGSAFFDIGLLNRKMVERIEPLFNELRAQVEKWEKTNPRDGHMAGSFTNARNVLSRLKYNPYCFRDIVNDFAYMERNLLDLHARLLLLEKYEPRAVSVGRDNEPGTVAQWAIGAWTTEPSHVQALLRAGIPVWYVRTRDQFLAAMATRARPNVEAVVEIERPPRWIVTSLPANGIGEPEPTHIFYEGLSGDAFHAFSRRPIFVGQLTVTALQEYPAPPPEVEGIYDRYTVRDISKPATQLLVEPDRHNVAVHHKLTAAVSAFERQTTRERHPASSSSTGPSRGSSYASSSSAGPSRSGYASSSAAGPSRSSQASNASAAPSRTSQASSLSAFSQADTSASEGGDVGAAKKHRKRTSAQRSAAKRAKATDPYPVQTVPQRDKWVDPESNFMPEVSQVWKEALDAVDKRKERLEPNRPRVGAGYRWPEPALFVTTKNQGRYLVNWLAGRHAWLARMTTATGVGDSGGSNQIWREYLGFDHDGVHRNDTFSANCRKQAEALFGAQMKNKRPDKVYWQQQELLAKDVEAFDSAAERQTMREVVWDAFEHSFRFEVRALDRLAAPQEWERDPAGRDHMVSIIFGGRYGMNVLPQANVGVLCDYPPGRVAALEAFRKILLAWKDPPDEVKNFEFKQSLLDDGPLEVALALIGLRARVMAKFYCQTFWNWFARPPVLPHYLPRADTQS